MKMWTLFWLLSPVLIYAQPDTLDLDKGEPILLMEPVKRHIPTIHSTEEFQKQVQTRDSLEQALVRKSNKPITFGLRENNIIKIYLLSGTCNGFPIEYQLQFTVYEDAAVARYAENQLSKLDLLVIKLHSDEQNDTLFQDHGVYAITIRNESNTTLVEVEGAIMNQLCSIEPVRINCPVREEDGMYRVTSGEIGETGCGVPDYDKLAKRFLLGKDIRILYPDGAEAILLQDEMEIATFELKTPSNGGLSYFTPKDGEYHRDLHPYTFHIGNRLLTDKKHKLSVKWNENGNEICKGAFKNLNPVAKWKYYYPDGTLRAVGKYKQFKDQDNFSDQIGKWSYYHPNGQLMAKGSYIMSSDPNVKYTILGKDWEFYDPQGNRVSKREIVKLYEPKEVIMPLPDYLQEVRDLVYWGIKH